MYYRKAKQRVSSHLNANSRLLKCRRYKNTTSSMLYKIEYYWYYILIENFDGVSDFNPWNQWLGKSLIYLREVRLGENYYTSCTVFFVYNPLIYVHSSNIQKKVPFLSQISFCPRCFLQENFYIHLQNVHHDIVHTVFWFLKSMMTSKHFHCLQMWKRIVMFYTVFFCLPYLPYSIEFCYMYYLMTWIKVTWSHVFFLLPSLKTNSMKSLKGGYWLHSSFLCATIFPHLVTIQSGN